MKVFCVVALMAGLGFAATACGSGGSPPTSEPGERTKIGSPRLEGSSASGDLPDLARALIPEDADRVAEGELAVEECGIAPAFPCVRVYFVMEDLDLATRIALLRKQARSAGWRIGSERRAGSVIEMHRKPFVATYMLEGDDPLLCEAASRCLAGTMLTVFGPPTPLPAPSEAERARWSADKQAYIRDANAICDRMLAQAASRPDSFPEALGNGLEDLAALEPPAGEEELIEDLLRPLRNVVRAAHALTDTRDEDALPAAVAVAEFAKRFNRAAASYGLADCAEVG